MAIGFALLPIEVPVFTEVTTANGNWHPHFNKNGYEGGWDVFTLRSPGGDADNIFAELAGKAAYADTPNMLQFPTIKTLVSSLHCEVMSARLLNLKAGAIIKQHRDQELAFEKGEARLHFPIITNDRVEFYVKDIRVTMLPGQCWYINANMLHRVANYGHTDRIHLVVDCVVNDWLKDIFAAADRTEFNEPVDHTQTLQVIQALRFQNTDTTRKLADKMEAEMQGK